MDLSRDSHSGKDVQILNGLHPKSNRQSCQSHMRRFFYSVASVLSSSPAPLRVVSSPIRATRVQCPWTSFFLYTHPHAAATIAFPQFSISSFLSLTEGSGERLKRLMSNYCKEKKSKKNHLGDSGSLLASSQLCERK